MVAPIGYIIQYRCVLSGTAQYVNSTTPYSGVVYIVRQLPR